MKIGILSHEFAPFPGGGIATYNNAAARLLAEAGHEVHVITNNAWFGQTAPEFTQRLWKRGNLTVHRLNRFDERREPATEARFFDINAAHYGDRMRNWAFEPSNIAAHIAAGHLEALHLDVGLDVLEVPEFFAEAFYAIRQRRSGRRAAYPPIVVHGHVSSRLAFGANRHAWELGWLRHRQMMLREEYCIQHADALLTPSRALMQLYEQSFGGRLPNHRETIPYFLDLPAALGPLPAGLDAAQPFLVMLGRFEPRKGVDVALRAFAELAPRHPDLQLVVLGKEMWHQGVRAEDVVAACVPEAHRKRVLRLGNVPREQALAAVQAAQAFLHPVPWDNYPCAVLEAMGVGAACVVSDRGGQVEMIEHERSGLICPALDHAALANAIERVLAEPALRDRLAAGARQRVAEITNPADLIRRKEQLFEAVAARERRGLSECAVQQFDMPPRLRPVDPLPPLPHHGLIVLDAGAADAGAVTATAEMLLREVRSSAPAWRICVLHDHGQRLDTTPTWLPWTPLDVPPWCSISEGAIVVYVLAGVRFDRGCLRNLISLAADGDVPCASFAWLRPANARVFPYMPDSSVQDLLVAGRPLPANFAAPANWLRDVRSLSSLLTPAQRLVGLLAAAIARGDAMAQHVGDVCGDWYGEQLVLGEEEQQRAVGFLDFHAVLDRRITLFGNVEIPVAHAPIAAPSPAPGGAPGSASAASSTSGIPYEELERVYHQHMSLKRMGIVRMMRKLGAFDIARKLFPKSKKLIGPG